MTIGGGMPLELLAVFNQFFAGNFPILGLQAMAMLFALVFDDGEITASVRAIQALPHLGQNEAAGLLGKRTDSVDGDHQQQGWRGGAKGSRTRRHCMWRLGAA
jgi:hypothetical protein